MKHRLIYLAAILVIFFSVGVSIVQPVIASAAGTATRCPQLDPNCIGGGGKPGQKPDVKTQCPSSMAGFPTANDNPVTQPVFGTNAFFTCEVTWAKASPASYVPGTAVGNNPADYCHRNFTGSYSTSCLKGFNLNGQGSPSATCGNDAACLVGAAVGGDPNQNPSAPSGGGGGNGNSPPTCESSSDFSLSWIFCPVIEGLASAVDGIYSSLIQPLLQVKPVDISNSNGDPTHTFAIWSNFRIYGDVLLVIALLVVVFGESIGGGLIDAYTAKKILPRLLVAAILINISIFIVAFAVDITNIAGNGIESLIQAPFHTAACAAQNKHFSAGQSCFALNISGAAADVGGLGVIGLVGAGAGGIWAAATGSVIATGILWPLLEFLLIMVLIPALLIFVAILATLLFRQGLILFLVLISPIAFALYCLPNTEQYFRKWWDLLFKTLLIYPLIAVIFALANVLSVTIDSTTTGIAKPFADFLAILALLSPLFLIPFSFRIAGGVIGQFHDLATNARKRAHGGIIGSEQNPDSWRNRTRDKLRQGRREAGMDSRIIGDSLKAVPGSGQWRQNWQARRASSRTLEGQRFLEHDEVALANKGNDQYYLAGANPELAKQMRDKAAATPGKEAEVRSWDNAIAGANLMPESPAIKLAMAQQHAATGFQYAQGQEGYDQLADTMSGITGAQLVRDGAGHVTGASGPRAGAFADAMDNAQFAEKGAGRWDLAGINRGAGYDPGAGLKKASLYEIANGKPESITAMAQDVPAAGPVGEQHAIAYKELDAMLPNAKGASRDKIVEHMGNLESRGVRGFMNAPTGNTNRGRRTYDPAAPGAAGWAPEERARGWRIEDIPETRGDLAQKKARNYERPDPNNL